MAAAKTAKKDRHLRHAEYYGLTEAFDDLYARSQAQAVFTNLMPLILSEENIRLAYRNIKRNTGSRTAGVDHLTMSYIEKLSSEEVVSKVRHKLAYYKPKPVRRVEIPKPNGKTRPLGIPAIWDRLVQQCILQVLEPICEAKFHDRSNGFRPNRSTEHAIAQAMRMIQRPHKRAAIQETQRAGHQCAWGTVGALFPEQANALHGHLGNTPDWILSDTKRTE